MIVLAVGNSGKDFLTQHLCYMYIFYVIKYNILGAEE